MRSMQVACRCCFVFFFLCCFTTAYIFLLRQIQTKGDWPPPVNLKFLSVVNWKKKCNFQSNSVFNWMSVFTVASRGNLFSPVALLSRQTLQRLSTVSWIKHTLFVALFIKHKLLKTVCGLFLIKTQAIMIAAAGTRKNNPPPSKKKKTLCVYLFWFSSMSSETRRHHH